LPKKFAFITSTCMELSRNQLYDYLLLRICYYSSSHYYSSQQNKVIVYPIIVQDISIQGRCLSSTQSHNRLLPTSSTLCSRVGLNPLSLSVLCFPTYSMVPEVSKTWAPHSLSPSWKGRYHISWEFCATNYRALQLALYRALQRYPHGCSIRAIGSSARYLCARPNRRGFANRSWPAMDSRGSATVWLAVHVGQCWVQRARDHKYPHRGWEYLPFWLRHGPGSECVVSANDFNYLNVLLNSIH
jgi:hypothetical protein